MTTKDRKILVADVIELLHRYGHALEELGHEVHTTHLEEEVLLMLQCAAVPYDLVVIGPSAVGIDAERLLKTLVGRYGMDALRIVCVSEQPLAHPVQGGRFTIAPARIKAVLEAVELELSGMDAVFGKGVDGDG